MESNFKRLSCALGLVCSVAIFTETTHAYEVTKIGWINGEENPNHARVLEVTPGEIIGLSADVYDKYGRYYQPQERPLDEFVWAADNRPGAECDAYFWEDCAGYTDFVTNEWGVNYYVPYDLPYEIRITVRNKNLWGEDTLILRNKFADYSAPTVLITHPDQYYVSYPHHKKIHASYYLAGHGRWVWIGGVKYFVPYTYKKGWSPYQNGYWSWSSDGWTWISYDPWGAYTDHYGYWRHHSTYGWIWCKFPASYYYYHPHTVSFFYTSSHVGWYPYFGLHISLYSHGSSYGFIDGYWAGFQAGQHYGNHHHYHFGGFSVVHHQHFGSKGVYRQLLATEQALQRYKNAYEKEKYGQHPWAQTKNGSIAWARQRIANIEETSVGSVGGTSGRERFQYAQRTGQIPEEFLGARNTEWQRFNDRIAVGSVIEDRGRGFEPQITTPVVGGNRDLGFSRRETPRSSAPEVGRADPNPDHPIGERIITDRDRSDREGTTPGMTVPGDRARGGTGSSGGGRFSGGSGRDSGLDTDRGSTPRTGTGPGRGRVSPPDDWDAWRSGQTGRSGRSGSGGGRFSGGGDSSRGGSDQADRGTTPRTSPSTGPASGRGGNSGRDGNGTGSRATPPRDSGSGNSSGRSGRATPPPSYTPPSTSPSTGRSGGRSGGRGSSGGSSGRSATPPRQSSPPSVGRSGGSGRSGSQIGRGSSNGGNRGARGGNARGGRGNSGQKSNGQSGKKGRG